MKYFIASDIHSFFDPFIQALNEAGFDKDNPEHVLIIDGDLFDRGKQTVELFDFLMSLDRDRLILIEGNHEQLFRELLESDWPKGRDEHNGTLDTFFQIAGVPFDYIDKWSLRLFDGTRDIMDECELPYYDEYHKRWDEVRNKVRESDIAKFIMNESNFIHYKEIGPYIITHSFLPIDDSLERLCDNWRENPQANWKMACWISPLKFYDDGLFLEESDKGKTLICGHFGSSFFHEFYGHKRNLDTPYYGLNILQIDATTIFSDFVNVISFSDDDYTIYYKGKELERSNCQEEASHFFLLRNK